jgi:hypothetical protein
MQTGTDLLKKRAGRPKFSRAKDTLSAKRLAGLVGVAREGIADGRPCLSLEGVAYATGASVAAVRYWVNSGLIPGVVPPQPSKEGFRSGPVVPAECLLSWLRSQYPAML